MTETDRIVKETRISRLRVHFRRCDIKRVASSIVCVVCTIILVFSVACFWRSFQVSSFLGNCDYSDEYTYYNQPRRAYWSIGDGDSDESFVAIEVGQLSQMYKEAKRDTTISALVSVVMVIGSIASACLAAKYSSETRSIEKEYTKLNTQLADDSEYRGLSRK